MPTFDLSYNFVVYLKWMKSYSLDIAGYRMTFVSDNNGPDLLPHGRFNKFICDTPSKGLTIKVLKGVCEQLTGSKEVFSAPYVEEINGVQTKKSEEFWSVRSSPSSLFIKVAFPLEETEKKAVLVVPRGGDVWELWIQGEAGCIDPLAYPLDGLVLYYLTVIHGDLMVHASGVEIHNKGYLFSGVSGKGKSTMASLWREAGAMVVHDDRLIIRKSVSGYTMYNTPVYPDEEPQKAPLNKIYLIEHAPANKEVPVKGSVAVAALLANCIQHNWNPEIVSATLQNVASLCSSVPVYRLGFLPDKSVINFILGKDKKITADNIKSMGLRLLGGGTPIQITAKGYSMYPTIKPETVIVIEPSKEPKLGEIIAVEREGKIVVHRLVEISRNDGKTELITRGDSNLGTDLPVGIARFMGKVAGYPTVHRIPEKRYRFNKAIASLAIIWDKVFKLSQQK